MLVRYYCSCYDYYWPVVIDQISDIPLSWQMLAPEAIDALTTEIEAEKEAEAERKKAEKRAGGDAQSTQ